MEEKIQKLTSSALTQIDQAQNKIQLEDLRIQHLGKKGDLTLIFDEIVTLPQKQKKKVGQLANEAKKQILAALAKKAKKFTKVGKVWIDVTAPGVKPKLGHLHPVTAAISEIVPIFERIGFTRTSYPEVETDYYAFKALNMPKGHPARDDWETFYITDEIVLTPHTSSGQVREMEKGKLPIRMLNIAKCYRRQSDISHTPMFHQFEGLLVDRYVSIANLKGVLDYFVKAFFGPSRKSRIRPFHFRFTEPSFEVDVTCGVCDSKGCRLCKQGWLELGGAGMVHPKVLEYGGIDAKIWSGFAFGWGVERAYMMKESLKLPDIRILYENDLRFLEQF